MIEVKDNAPIGEQLKGTDILTTTKKKEILLVLKTFFNSVFQ